MMINDAQQNTVSGDSSRMASESVQLGIMYQVWRFGFGWARINSTTSPGRCPFVSVLAIRIYIIHIIYTCVCVL